MMQGYHVEGFDLWSENYQRYKTPSPIPVADVTLSVINLIESGNNNANVSAKSESQYLRPYRINTNNIAYNGYNWNQNKYLNPIAFDHFRLTTAEEGSTDYTTSTIYQNPGWKIETSSLPERTLVFSRLNILLKTRSPPPKKEEILLFSIKIVFYPKKSNFTAL